MEKVQLSLERFLPELRDLSHRKIFTSFEISQIVNKRRSFEISLASRSVSVGDYLRYIEYESALERLRSKRAKRTTKEKGVGVGGGKSSKSLSDHSITAHITQLYNLATRRFPSSLPLWSSFISHTFSLSSPLLISRTLSSAIAQNPLRKEFWLLAIKFEEDGTENGMGGGNTEGARKLSMRALRFLKGKGKEEDGDEGEMEIWKEWIRVEIAFVERLRKREEVLGIGKGVKVPDPFRREENEDDMEVDGNGEEVELPQEDLEEEGEKSSLEKEVESTTQELHGKTAILSGQIILLVLSNCLSSYSHSLTIYRTLLLHLRHLFLPSPSSSFSEPESLPLFQKLLNHLYTSLEEQHPTSVEAIEMLADRFLEEGGDGEGRMENVGKSVEVWWKSLKKIKKDMRREGYQKFARWLVRRREEEEEGLEEFLNLNLQRIFQKAGDTPSLLLLRLQLSPSEEVRNKLLVHSSSSSVSTKLTKEKESIFLSLLSSSPSPSEELLKIATDSLPYSSSLWSRYAEYVNSPECTWEYKKKEGWWFKAIERVLRTDALPPVDGGEGKGERGPRETLPLLWLNSTPPPNEKKLKEMVERFPTLPISVLRHLPSSKEVYERILMRYEREGGEGEGEGEMETWLEYARYLVMDLGRTEEGMRVVERARRRGGKLGWEGEFGRRWGEM